jgi:hypothetical protein
VYDYDLNKPSIIVPINVTFRNCIFWGENGTVTNEVGVYKKSGSSSVIFDHVLWKVESTPANATVILPAINQPPLFDSINIGKNYYDFHLKSVPLSPAIDKGNPVTIGSYDLDGKTRVNTPDLGCYEKQ